jgi:hypothetical protein
MLAGAIAEGNPLSELAGGKALAPRGRIKAVKD